MTVAALPLRSLPAPSGDARSLCRDLAALCGGRASVDDPDRIAYARDCWPKAVLWTQAGRTPPPPDVVAWPATVDEVQAVVRYAAARGVPVVPFGGGSGVCGGTLALHGGICLDLKRLARVGAVDPESLEVDAEVGVVGEHLERRLARDGYTLGHFPSSIYCSTLGGWLAARSAGQCSNKYGKIEDMVASVSAVLGTGDIVTAPRRPAPGALLAQLLLGSEGTLGVLTGARLFVHPTPPTRGFAAYRFRSFAEGLEAIRLLFRAGARPAVVRLYDPFDTLITSQTGQRVKRRVRASGPSGSRRRPESQGALAAAKDRLRRLALATVLGRPARLNRVADALSAALLLLVFEGDDGLVAAEQAVAADACRRGAALGPGPVRAWMDRRYAVSYAQSKIFAAGAFVDTMETAATWDRVPTLYRRVRAAVASHAFVMAHASHAYLEGCSLYFTFAAAAESLSEAERRYDRIWSEALAASLLAGGAVSHHHGVGLSKAAALRSELGAGFAVLEALKGAADPAGVLNPGKLGLGGGGRTVAVPPSEPFSPAPGPKALGAGWVDPISCTVAASGAERLRDVEERCAAAGLTLGALPPHLFDRTVEEWLAGPWQGLRAVPGGRLETAALALEVRLADRLGGATFWSSASPRSAAGPDLDALFLGGRGRHGEIVAATLRAQPIPEDARWLAAHLGGTEAAVVFLRSLVRRGVDVAEVRLRHVAGGVRVHVHLAGAGAKVARDQAVFRAEARDAPVDAVPPRGTVDVRADAEVAWPQLPAAIARDADLYRLARESVEVVSAAQVPVGARAWPEPDSDVPASALARLVDLASPPGVAP